MGRRRAGPIADVDASSVNRRARTDGITVDSIHYHLIEPEPIVEMPAHVDVAYTGTLMLQVPAKVLLLQARAPLA